jgi:ATP-dependent helicase/nuclease subunit B
VWPAGAQADRFMSRMMKAGLSLEPPERRIGLAAHDFVMAAGCPRLVLTRAARQGDAPSVPSRWLQRLLAVIGPDEAARLRKRGAALTGWARALDTGPDIAFVPRPAPTPPVDTRPQRFSVTEVETLRRDPYAIYARRILRLEPLQPLLRDPGAAERGTLFHDILHRFTETGADPHASDAAERLVAVARRCFAEAGLPADVEAVWWPRFSAMAENIIAFERARAGAIAAAHAELKAEPQIIGATGAHLSGRADRIDVLVDGRADILDYKTGSGPSRGQAHTLVSPQLALEAALVERGAFTAIGPRQPADLAYVRLRPNGEVATESILTYKRQKRGAPELAREAWQRLERLVAHYQEPANGYLSRALPFREGDTDGDYDHLARVLEWSAGGDGGDDGGDEA